MNLHPRFQKMHEPDIGGAFACDAAEPELEPIDKLAVEAEMLSELYSEPVDMASIKKHSPSFVQNRRKLQQIAEAKLTHLSEELLKLAEEVRYYNPLMAEVLDEAWDATDEALTMLHDTSP